MRIGASFSASIAKSGVVRVSQPFLAFAELCQSLAATTKKLEKRASMAAYLAALPLLDAERAAQWLTGNPFSETDRRALNLGGASISRVLKEITGATDKALHAAYLRHGDLGGAAFDLMAGRQQPGSSLTLEEVDVALDAIAGPAGKPQVTATKQKIFREILSHATALETKYLVKLVIGDMRTGVKQAQVEEAIGVAYARELKQVRHAVMLLGDLRQVVAMAAEDRLDKAKMKLFHPLGFMLASPVETVEEALERFGQEIAAERLAVPPGAEESGATESGATEQGAPGLASETWVSDHRSLLAPQPAPSEGEGSASVLSSAPLPATAQLEDKYDGIRAQLHCGDPSEPGRVALFSRSRDDMTHSFPEVAEAFAAVDQPLILDGELLAWTTPTADDPGRALPFSSLQPRIGRKKVTAQMRKATPVVFMAFDLLYAGGELLLEKPLVERRSALIALVEQLRPRVLAGSEPAITKQQVGLFAPATPANSDAFERLVLAPAVDLQSAEQLDQAYAEARARGNEGVMLKAKSSLYQPGRRGLAWLKLKRELATLDVVVTSAEWGHGRRAQTLSDVTFAVRDGDDLKNVGKAYSGLTDVEIAQLTAWFLEHTLEDFGSWRAVEPKIVLEVAFNNLMRSDRHASGFAMRFPRILKIRDDKPVEEIDTLERVEEIFNSQPDKPIESL
jgi:DNA ligase-1